MQIWDRGFEIVNANFYQNQREFFTVLWGQALFLLGKNRETWIRALFLFLVALRESARFSILSSKMPWSRDFTKTENFGDLCPKRVRGRRKNRFSVESFRDQRSLYNPLIERDIERNKKTSSWSRMTPGRSKNGGRWETRTLDLIRVKDAF